MPIPRLHPDRVALLVIDVQEKLIPAIHQSQRLVHNCSLLLRFASEMNLPCLATEHYPQGLGRTVEGISDAMIDETRRIEKTRFSGAIDVVLQQLTAWRRTQVLVCGIEAHVCVLLSVLDLQAAGYQCFVVSDAVAASQVDQIEWAFRRMESAGAVPTGVMSAMYEILGDASHPSRRAVVDLARTIA